MKRDQMKKKNDSIRRAADKKKEARNQVKAKAYKQKDSSRGGRPAKKRSAENEAEVSYETQQRRPLKNGEKAYKLLAAQMDISNAKAKDLIDRGLVYVGNKKVMIARGDLDVKTIFTVREIAKVRPIFENDDLIVVDKPAFMNADEVEHQFKGAQLLHRLDRETSGVLILVKNEAFREQAIAEFKNDRVYKEYVAWVEGIVTEEIMIDKPILTEKRHNKAYSKISNKGKPARSEVYPLEVSGKKSKVKVIIHEGRTHQIRTHLRSVEHPIVGDELYGGRRAERVMLHAKKVELMGMTFEAKEPKIFAHFGS